MHRDYPIRLRNSFLHVWNLLGFFCFSPLAEKCSSYYSSCQPSAHILKRLRLRYNSTQALWSYFSTGAASTLAADCWLVKVDDQDIFVIIFIFVYRDKEVKIVSAGTPGAIIFIRFKFLFLLLNIFIIKCKIVYHQYWAWIIYMWICALCAWQSSCFFGGAWRDRDDCPMDSIWEHRKAERLGMSKLLIPKESLDD